MRCLSRNRKLDIPAVRKKYSGFFAPQAIWGPETGGSPVKIVDVFGTEMILNTRSIAPRKRIARQWAVTEVAGQTKCHFQYYLWLQHEISYRAFTMQQNQIRLTITLPWRVFQRSGLWPVGYDEQQNISNSTAALLGRASSVEVFKDIWRMLGYPCARSK